MMKPRLLDLFCGAGGCSAGYVRAGFDVVGVDNRQQPNYPFAFVQTDALQVLDLIAQGRPWNIFRPGDFAVIHASPPCQAYSRTRTIWKRHHPDLLAETRGLLQATGLPFVIENVHGAPLQRGRTIMLCGTFFGLRVIRHRYFESSVALMCPGNSCEHPPRGSVVQTGRPAVEGQFMVIAGHFSSLAVARRCMGIDWMTRDELAQSIPPAYTEFVGRQLLNALEAT